MTTEIYSIRNNTNPNKNGLSFLTTKELFLEELRQFESVGFFAEKLSGMCYYCGEGNGIQSNDNSRLKSLIIKSTHKAYLFPLSDKNIIENYQEDDLFDLIEFLNKYVSLPYFKSEDGSRIIPSFAKAYCNRGHYWHPENFDKEEGQDLFRIKINEILDHYSLSKPYQLRDGAIFIKAEAGLNNIIDAPLKTNNKTIKSKVDHSIKKYLGRNSTVADRVDAVRNLFDILEDLKPQTKNLPFSKDESDLFNIANNFSIRHHNKKQQNEYDPIWLSWMFYNCLSFIHVILHYPKKNE